MEYLLKDKNKYNLETNQNLMISKTDLVKFILGMDLDSFSFWAYSNFQTK